MHAVFEPLALWRRVQARLARDRGTAMRDLAVAIAAGAVGVASAASYGRSEFGTQWNADLGFHAGALDAFGITLAGFVLAPLCLAAMYWALAPLYRLPRRPLEALAVAVVGGLPVYGAGLLMFVLPAVLLLFSAFILSCFWWNTGLRTVLGLKGSDAVEMGVLALLGMMVLLQFAGGILASLF